MHTSQNIFLQLKIHVHDRSTAENPWISTKCKFSQRVLCYRSSTYKSPQMSKSIHGKYIMKIPLDYLQDLWLRNTQKICVHDSSLPKYTKTTYCKFSQHIYILWFQTSWYLDLEKYETIFLKYEIFNDGQFTDLK
jgi:hypothetical protein